MKFKLYAVISSMITVYVLLMYVSVESLRLLLLPVLALLCALALYAAFCEHQRDVISACKIE